MVFPGGQKKHPAGGAHGAHLYFLIRFTVPSSPFLTLLCSTFTSPPAASFKVSSLGTSHDQDEEEQEVEEASPVRNPVGVTTPLDEEEQDEGEEEEDNSKGDDEEVQDELSVEEASPVSRPVIPQGTPPEWRDFSPDTQKLLKLRLQAN